MTCAKRYFAGALLTVSLVLTPLRAAANSTPVRIDRDPIFEITPLTDTPLEVARELLTLKVGSSASEATLTAAYEIVNPDAQPLSIPMIFPAISQDEPLSMPRITLNGRELAFELYVVGAVGVKDYFADPEAYAEQVDLNAIVDVLNQPVYQPQSFDPEEQATLYRVTLGGATGRQSTISFEFDPAVTRIISLNHQGFFGSRSGTGSQVAFSRHVDTMTLGQTMDILVIGDDRLQDLTVSAGDSLTKQSITAEDFLKAELFSVAEPSIHVARRNTDNFYSAVLRELDSGWIENTSSFFAARPLDDVVNNILYSNNLSVFLFTADFPAESTSELTVSYPVRAMIDRSVSSDYVNTFAYILNPAANFADFGTLDIEILLNDHAPYILESSIPLETRGDGRYFASFSGLPEVDLVFSTYSRPTITPLDSLRANISYPVLILIIAAAFFLAITAVLTLIRKLPGSAR